MKQDVNTIPTTADFSVIRRDFPVLDTEVNGHPLVYLDSAASSQMPRQVADRLDRYHRAEHANVHRGVHALSQRATDAYEQVREKVNVFTHAGSGYEVVFTTGTTDSINLVASSYGRQHLSERDEIILTEMEHHANIVPWQMVAGETGAKIRVVPVLDNGVLDMEAYRSLLGPRTRMVSVVHVSNALGTVNPVEEIVELAHQQGAKVLIDGAQSIPHKAVDLQALDCDFYVFSAHKMCGPTGFGILIGRKELLDEMPPYRGGGDMIDKVSFEETTYNISPHRFEAGTPPIAAGIGLGAAIDYLNGIGMDRIAEREQELVSYALDRLKEVEGLNLVGSAPERASAISFLIDGVHAHDIGTLLDKQGIAVRTGHHCAQPLMRRFGIPGTARASFSFYNNEEDVDRLVEGLLYVKSFF